MGKGSWIRSDGVGGEARLVNPLVEQQPLFQHGVTTYQIGPQICQHHCRCRGLEGMIVKPLPQPDIKAIPARNPFHGP